MLKPGDKAPDFTLLDQHGQPFSLSKSIKQQKVKALDLLLPADRHESVSGAEAGSIR